MRPKERIPIFLKLVKWPDLQTRWNTIYNHTFFINEVERYWLNNPDQRIGQALINLGLIPDILNIWMDEEQDILLDQGVEPREFLFWTSLFDKEGNRLEEPITRLIKDLDSNHIKNILNDNRLRLSELYKKTFENELGIRGYNKKDLLEAKANKILDGLKKEDLYPKFDLFETLSDIIKLRTLYQ